MRNEARNKLMRLRAMVAKIPNNASPDNIWSFLGWSEEASKDYEVAKKYDIDIRPLIAPDFSDVVSIVVDGWYMPKGHDWESILSGQDLEFIGPTPKERMLSVFDTLLQPYLDS